MGGNALKNCTTRRYERCEYFELEDEVVQQPEPSGYYTAWGVERFGDY